MKQRLAKHQTKGLPIALVEELKEAGENLTRREKGLSEEQIRAQRDTWPEWQEWTRLNAERLKLQYPDSPWVGGKI